VSLFNLGSEHQVVHVHLYMSHPVLCCMLSSGTLMILPGLTIITLGGPNDPLLLPGSNTRSNGLFTFPRVRYMENRLFQWAHYFSWVKWQYPHVFPFTQGQAAMSQYHVTSPRVKQQCPNIILFLPGSK